jgi:S1-C subfamily serine protease
VRLRTVAFVSLLAALAGAAGVVVAGQTGGWMHDGTQTVVLRQPLESGTARTIVISKPVLGHGFRPDLIYLARAPGVVTVFARFGGADLNEGSGFVVSAAGYVLTAAHVISAAEKRSVATAANGVYVQFADGDRLQATIVGVDPFDDVGLLHVDPRAHALDSLPLGSSARIRVGEPVATIGSPFGNESSLSVGVISATHRAIPSLLSSYDLLDAIQTDAPINEGNSGGPLLNSAGRVIGINAQIRSQAGAGFEGVAFAVPIDIAIRSLAQLVARGHVTYAYAGLTTEDLTPTISRRFGYGARAGALVDFVAKGGPAAVAGLRPGTQNALVSGQEVTIGGDAIVAIDGIPVASSDDVARMISERLLPGQVADFTIVRGARRLHVAVTLGSRRQ